MTHTKPVLPPLPSLSGEFRCSKRNTAPSPASYRFIYPCLFPPPHEGCLKPILVLPPNFQVRELPKSPKPSFRPSVTFKQSLVFVFDPNLLPLRLSFVCVLISTPLCRYCYLYPFLRFFFVSLFSRRGGFSPIPSPPLPQVSLPFFVFSQKQILRSIAMKRYGSLRLFFFLRNWTPFSTRMAAFEPPLRYFFPPPLPSSFLIVNRECNSAYHPPLPPSSFDVGQPFLAFELSNLVWVASRFLHPSFFLKLFSLVAVTKFFYHRGNFFSTTVVRMPARNSLTPLLSPFLLSSFTPSFPSFVGEDLPF